MMHVCIVRVFSSYGAFSRARTQDFERYRRLRLFDVHGCPAHTYLSVGSIELNEVYC